MLPLAYARPPSLSSHITTTQPWPPRHQRAQWLQPLHLLLLLLQWPAPWAQATQGNPWATALKPRNISRWCKNSKSWNEGWKTYRKHWVQVIARNTEESEKTTTQCRQPRLQHLLLRQMTIKVIPAPVAVILVTPAAPALAPILTVTMKNLLERTTTVAPHVYNLLTMHQVVSRLETT